MFAVFFLPFVNTEAVCPDLSGWDAIYWNAWQVQWLSTNPARGHKAMFSKRKTHLVKIKQKILQSEPYCFLPQPANQISTTITMHWSTFKFWCFDDEIWNWWRILEQMWKLSWSVHSLCKFNRELGFANHAREWCSSALQQSGVLLLSATKNKDSSQNLIITIYENICEISSVM